MIMINYTNTALITLLGFDITHAVIAYSAFNPQEAVCVLASVNGAVDPRSEIAFSSFFNVVKLRNANVNVFKVVVEVTNIQRTIDELYEQIKSHVSKYRQVILDLGGGLRLLVIETLLALLRLKSSERRSIKTIVFIEGRNEYIELPDVSILTLQVGELEKVSEKGRALLKLMEPQREYKLSELHEILERALGQRLSKVTVYKIVKELEDVGLVIRVRRGIYVKVT